jgi:hypothetical protein
MKSLKPSKLGLVAECAAAAQRSEPFPFVPSPASERGKMLHAVVARIMRGGAEVFDEAAAGLSDMDRAAVKTCVDLFNLKVRPGGKFLIQIETKLDLEALGMHNGGTPDVAVYDMDSRTVAVVDWKFGSGPVSDPFENKQLIAYLLAVVDDLAKAGYVVDKGYLVVVQPQADPGKSYRDHVVEAGEFPGWRESIRQWIKAALAPKPPARPGPWCRSQFCDAGKNGACPEYDEWRGERQEAREATKTAEREYAVSGFNPIVVSAPVPQLPIVVLDAAAVARAQGLRDEMFALEVVDQATADRMGALLAESTKFEGQIDANRLIVKRPVIELERAIDDAAKLGLNALREGKGEGKMRIDAWIKGENKRREDAARVEREKAEKLAEQARLQAEADAKAAADRLKKAKTEAARKQALLDQADALKRQAEPPPAPPPAPVIPAKAAGTNVVKEPQYAIPDPNQIPRDYLVLNEPALVKAIKAFGWGKNGTPCPSWLKVEWVDRSRAKGGR